MEKRVAGHSTYKTAYHIVFDTKYRHSILKLKIKAYLRKLLPKILKTITGCDLLEYNIQPDHVHMLMIIPPKYSVSWVVGRIKGKASSKIRKKFPELQEHYWKDNIIWQPGFHVSSVGRSEKKTLEYIRNQ